MALVCRVPRAAGLIVRSDVAPDGDVDVSGAFGDAAGSVSFAGLAGAFAVWAFACSSAPGASGGAVQDWDGFEDDGAVA